MALFLAIQGKGVYIIFKNLSYGDFHVIKNGDHYSKILKSQIRCMNPNQKSFKWTLLQIKRIKHSLSKNLINNIYDGMKNSFYKNMLANAADDVKKSRITSKDLIR